jgi:outer membrane immunogenic protein
MKKFVAPLVMLAFVSAPAFAADKAVAIYRKAPIYKKAPPPAEPVAAAYDWSGFYLGASGGYGWAKDAHLDVQPGSGAFTNPGGPAQTIKAEGVMYGGQVGYNWQSSSFVYGLEISGHAANIRKTDPSIFLATDSLSAKVDDIITATGRIGLAFNNVMPYVKGGYATAHLTTTNFDNAPDVLRLSGWHDGFTVGGGVEYGLTSNWVFGAEYNYMDLGTKSVSGTTVFANGTTFPERFSDKLTVATVTGRLSYKFGGPEFARY